MSASLILDRLDANPTGRDRWRAACPSCGGKNKSKVSIGIGDNGAVLLRCWAGCSIESICAALGIDVVDLFPPKDASAPPLRRRRLLSAGQALELLEQESLVVWVVASDIVRGNPITNETKDRVTVAAGRIGELRQETRA